MYYIFNLSEYLGCYVVPIDLGIFLDTFAINNNLERKNLSAHEALGELPSNLPQNVIIKYSPEKIEYCIAELKQIMEDTSIFNVNEEGLNENEIKIIKENLEAMKNGQSLPNQWPKKPKLVTKNLETIINSITLIKKK